LSVDGENFYTKKMPEDLGNVCSKCRLMVKRESENAR